MDYDKIIKRVGNVRPSTSDIKGAVDIDVTCLFNPVAGRPYPSSVSTSLPFTKYHDIDKWVIHPPAFWLDAMENACEGQPSPFVLNELIEEIERRGNELAKEFEISEFAVAEVQAYRKEKAGGAVEYGTRIHDRIERAYREEKVRDKGLCHYCLIRKALDDVEARVKKSGCRKDPRGADVYPYAYVAGRCTGTLADLLLLSHKPCDLHREEKKREGR